LKKLIEKTGKLIESLLLLSPGSQSDETPFEEYSQIFFVPIVRES